MYQWIFNLDRKIFRQWIGEITKDTLSPAPAPARTHVLHDLGFEISYNRLSICHIAESCHPTINGAATSQIRHTGWALSSLGLALQPHAHISTCLTRPSKPCLAYCTNPMLISNQTIKAALV